MCLHFFRLRSEEIHARHRTIAPSTDRCFFSSPAREIMGFRGARVMLTLVSLMGLGLLAWPGTLNYQTNHPGTNYEMPVL